MGAYRCRSKQPGEEKGGGGGRRRRRTMRTTRRWRSNSGGRTCRLAIFRVHSVAKPQLTALLGSYSFSRPLASSLPHPALLLFRFLFSSHFSFSSALPLFFSSVFTRPTVSPLVRPLLIFFFLALTAVFLFFRSLPHCITHTRFLSLSCSIILEFVRFLLLYSFLRDF